MNLLKGEYPISETDLEAADAPFAEKNTSEARTTAENVEEKASER